MAYSKCAYRNPEIKGVGSDVGSDSSDTDDGEADDKEQDDDVPNFRRSRYNRQEDDILVEWASKRDFPRRPSRPEWAEFQSKVRCFLYFPPLGSSQSRHDNSFIYISSTPKGP